MKDKLNDIVCQSSCDYEILNDVYNYIERIEKENQQLKDIINKVNEKIDNMFDVGDENKIIDDLLELQKILDNKGEI